MIDIVIPKGNEEKFILMAEKLGYTSLVFVYNKEKDLSKLKTKLKLFTAVFNGKGDLFIASGKENARHILEKTNIDLIFGLEDHEERDFMHQRNSGLNQILCKIAFEKGKVICLDFNSVLKSSKMKRSLILGRMMQNIRLCKKYKVRLAIASFATDPYQMRSPSDLESFCVTLGLLDAKKALSLVYDKIQEKKKKKSPEYIAEGIEKI